MCCEQKTQSAGVRGDGDDLRGRGAGGVQATRDLVSPAARPHGCFSGTTVRGCRRGLAGVVGRAGDLEDGRGWTADGRINLSGASALSIFFPCVSLLVTRAPHGRSGGWGHPSSVGGKIEILFPF